MKVSEFNKFLEEDDFKYFQPCDLHCLTIKQINKLFDFLVEKRGYKVENEYITFNLGWQLKKIKEE